MSVVCPIYTQQRKFPEPADTLQGKCPLAMKLSRLMRLQQPWIFLERRVVLLRPRSPSIGSPKPFQWVRDSMSLSRDCERVRSKKRVCNICLLRAAEVR